MKKIGSDEEKTPTNQQKFTFPSKNKQRFCLPKRKNSETSLKYIQVQRLKRLEKEFSLELTGAMALLEKEICEKSRKTL